MARIGKETLEKYTLSLILWLEPWGTYCRIKRFIQHLHSILWLNIKVYKYLITSHTWTQMSSESYIHVKPRTILKNEIKWYLRRSCGNQEYNAVIGTLHIAKPWVITASIVWAMQSEKSWRNSVPSVQVDFVWHLGHQMPTTSPLTMSWDSGIWSIEMSWHQQPT